MPFLPCVIRKIAWNQVASGSLVCSNSVPAVIEVCRPHSAHCRRSLRSSRQCLAQPQEGQSNPEGQRSFAVSGHFATPRFRVEPGPPRPVLSSRNIFGKEGKR